MYGQAICCLFGAGGALILPGGSNITPATAFLPFLLAAAWLARQSDWARRIPQSGAWLLAYVFWALISAFLLPRALEGWTYIMTLDRATGKQLTLIPLRPVSGNVTQTFYVLGGAAVFFAVRELIRSDHGVITLRDSVLLLGAMNCFAAILNVAEFYLGLPSLTELTRNGTYANFSAYEEAGLVRIQGTFPETSSFSGFSIPLFAFSLNLWLRDVRPRYSGSIAIITLTLLTLSTSGTAYVSLGFYALCFAAHYAITGLFVRRFLRLRSLAILALFVLTLFGTIVVFELDIVDRVATFFDRTVASKMSTHSGQQRSSWNLQAWQNFLDTYGIGVGAGSARASSFAMVLLSNLGALGAMLFSLFFLHLFTGKPELLDESHRTTCIASRHAVFAMLIPALVSGGNVSLGLLFFFFAAGATLTGLASNEPQI